MNLPLSIYWFLYRRIFSSHRVVKDNLVICARGLFYEFDFIMNEHDLFKISLKYKYTMMKIWFVVM